jgi:hypothetical protein
LCKPRSLHIGGTLLGSIHQTWLKVLAVKKNIIAYLNGRNEVFNAGENSIKKIYLYQSRSLYINGALLGSIHQTWLKVLAVKKHSSLFKR